MIVDCTANDPSHYTVQPSKTKPTGKPTKNSQNNENHQTTHPQPLSTTQLKVIQKSWDSNKKWPNKTGPEQLGVSPNWPCPHRRYCLRPSKNESRSRWTFRVVSRILRCRDLGIFQALSPSEALLSCSMSLSSSLLLTLWWRYLESLKGFRELVDGFGVFRSCLTTLGLAYWEKPSASASSNLR